MTLLSLIQKSCLLMDFLSTAACAHAWSLDTRTLLWVHASFKLVVHLRTLLAIFFFPLNASSHLLLIALFTLSWCVSEESLGFSIWSWARRAPLIGGVLHRRHSQAVNGFQSTLSATAKAQLTALLCCLQIQDCSIHSYFSFYDTIRRVLPPQIFLSHLSLFFSPNKPKVCSVVMEAASLEWVKSVAWAQLCISCIFVACGAAMSNRWHLILKSTPKGTWSVLHQLVQSINLEGISYVTPIFQCKMPDTCCSVLLINGLSLVCSRAEKWLCPS